MRSLVLIVFLFATAPSAAQLREIRGLVTDPAGNLLQGYVHVTWPPFLAASGVRLEGGSTAAQIVDGLVEITLIANVMARPATARYHVQYFGASGALYTEEWIVPVGSGKLSLRQVQARPPTALGGAAAASGFLQGSGQPCVPNSSSAVVDTWNPTLIP